MRDKRRARGLLCGRASLDATVVAVVVVVASLAVGVLGAMAAGGTGRGGAAGLGGRLAGAPTAAERALFGAREARFQAELAARLRWLASPAQVAERKRSLTAYRGLSGAAAGSLWSGRLRDALGRVASWPQPGFGKSVVRFEGAYGAVIRAAGGREELALSSSPLRAVGGGGRWICG